MNAVLNNAIHALVIDPAAPDILYAGTMGDGVYVGNYLLQLLKHIAQSIELGSLVSLMIIEIYEFGKPLLK